MGLVSGNTVKKEHKDTNQIYRVSLNLAIIICFIAFLIPSTIELGNSVTNYEFMKDYIDVCKNFYKSFGK